MVERIVIDPLTRIEGHLKIEVEVENGVVTDAWCAGTMARGWEILLKDRDPRDAPYVCSRVCSVCEGVHGIAPLQEHLGERASHKAGAAGDKAFRSEVGACSLYHSRNSS